MSPEGSAEFSGLGRHGHLVGDEAQPPAGLQGLGDLFEQRVPGGRGEQRDGDRADDGIETGVCAGGFAAALVGARSERGGGAAHAVANGATRADRGR
ncbi:MAG: hypothetical protein ACK48N_00110, partial [Planctomyces sp.]